MKRYLLAAAIILLALGAAAQTGGPNKVAGLSAAGTAGEYKELVEGTGITITHDVGTITIATSGAASNHNVLSSVHSDALVAAVQRGSIIYGNATPKWARLAIGAANRALLSDGTDVAWGLVSLTAGVTGTLPVANGGTGAASFTANGVLYGNTASAVQVTAQGAANSVLTANAGAPAFSQTPIINTSVQLGVVSSATGSLKLAHASSANLTTITAGNASTASTYTWPTTVPASSGYALVSTTGGALSWAATAAGGGVVDEIEPRTSYPVTAGKLWPGVHTGAGSTVKYWEGMQVMASLDADATWNLVWKMPATIPSGTPKLRLDAIANTSSQNSKFQPQWGCVAASADPSSATLNDEGVQTGAWPASAADEIQQFDTALDAATFCTAGQWLVMNMKFATASWTVSVTSTWQASIVWVP